MDVIHRNKFYGVHKVLLFLQIANVAYDGTSFGFLKT